MSLTWQVPRTLTNIRTIDLREFLMAKRFIFVIHCTLELYTMWGRTTLLQIYQCPNRAFCIRLRPPSSHISQLQPGAGTTVRAGNVVPHAEKQRGLLTCMNDTDHIQSPFLRIERAIPAWNWSCFVTKFYIPARVSSHSLQSTSYTLTVRHMLMRTNYSSSNRKPGPRVILRNSLALFPE